METNKIPKSSSKKPSTAERREIERIRRVEMNELCHRLSSLIPPQPHFNPSQGRESQADKVERATHYVIELKERVKQLRERKEQLEKMISKEETQLNDDHGVIISEDGVSSTSNHNCSARLPIFQLSDMGDVIEVHLVTEAERNLKLREIIEVLEEEGGEVANTTFCLQGDKAFHTLHAKAKNSRVGIETSRVQQRLQELIR